MNAQNSGRRYFQEFKADAVSLVVEQGYSRAEVGRRLGVGENNVNRSIRQYHDCYESAPTQGLTREQPEDIRFYLTATVRSFLK